MDGGNRNVRSNEERHVENLKTNARVMIKEIPEWIAVYADLTFFSNLNGSWEDAPPWGMQAIIYKSKETGWSICTGGDHFHRLPNGEFIPLDDDGLVDYSANVWKTVKVGRQLSREEFNKVMRLANSIMGANDKTAYFKTERRE